MWRRSVGNNDNNNKIELSFFGYRLLSVCFIQFFWFFSHVFPCACYVLSSQEKPRCSLFALLWRFVKPFCVFALVEFALHSVADEDTIEVEADKGTTLLEVCQNEAVDITGAS